MGWETWRDSKLNLNVASNVNCNGAFVSIKRAFEPSGHSECFLKSNPVRREARSALRAFERFRNERGGDIGLELADDGGDIEGHAWPPAARDE
jgi:hypothetical protein